MNRSHISDHEKLQIKVFIRDMLAAGCFTNDVQRNVQEQFGVCYATARKYVGQVQNELAEQDPTLRQNRDMNLNLMIERLRLLFQKALERDEIGEARKTLKEMSRLMGFSGTKPPTEPSPFDAIEELGEISDEELVEALRYHKIPVPDELLRAVN